MLLDSLEQTIEIQSMQACLHVPAALARGALTSEEQHTISLFRENTPSVVFITNLATK